MRNQRYDIARKALGAAATVTIVAITLIKITQEFFDQAAPDEGRKISVIIISASLCLAASVAISLYREKLPTLFKLSFPRLAARADRIGFRKEVFIIIYLLVAASILCCVGPKTNIWRLGRSWWHGPKVDLISRDPDHTFQFAINLPWFKYGQDFGQVDAWGRAGVSENRSDFASTFKKLRQSGVDYVLWFLLFDGRGALEFDANGYVTGLDSTFFEDYDAAIEVARENEIGIVWVLLDFYFMFPARQENGASLFGHADVIEQSNKRASFLNNALKPILRRYPVESHIVGWVLVNEPEHALKDGNVSPESLRMFIHEASALIKQNTWRQPVSVGAADLESLMEYAGTYSADLDFYVFHHYELFLPPPVSHIRNLLAEESDKPIYIGEFNIKSPAVTANEFVIWSQRLGYAGLWPWNPNATGECDTGSVIPAYEEWKSISDSINTRVHSVKRLHEEFEKRHISSNFLAEGLRQEIDWWNRHWTTTVIPKVNDNISQWQSKTLFSEGEHEKNRRWESEKLRWQNVLNHRKAEIGRELKDRKRVDDLKSELERIEIELQRQQTDLETARQRAKLNLSLANYYRYRSVWAKALYWNYWEAARRFEQ
ncbi:MAG TPA: hypothetical protein VF131_01790 [Blastocatellia bacterium]|nr:hypothetical protein [Blastocatellia bacterium]